MAHSETTIAKIRAATIKLAIGAGWILVRLSECAIKAGRYDGVLNLAKVGG